MTQFTPEVHTYEDDFPRYLGPPPVANYTGEKLTADGPPTMLVQLDQGAFWALWELLEKEAKHRFPAAKAISSYAALLRAVKSFRTCYWSHNVPPEPPSNGPRRLVRKPRK